MPRARALIPRARALIVALSLSAASAGAPVLAFDRAERKAVRYNTSSRVLPGAINVHMQPHSHDDVGWLKTFDEVRLLLVRRRSALSANPALSASAALPLFAHCLTSSPPICACVPSI
jgi:hypothetical protein